VCIASYHACACTPLLIATPQLEDNSFSIFPRELLSLETLELLRLSGCRIAEVPPGIAQLAALRELALDGNPLDAIPGNICELRELRKLVLHGCRLERLPDSLGDLVQLEQLLVSSNRLHELPATIGGCARLRVLACNSNALESLPAALAYLPGLANVNAANNAIVTLPAVLARHWRASLPSAVVEACCDAEADMGVARALGAAADGALTQYPAPSSLLVLLDRNPVMGGGEAVPAITASQVGQLSIVEELRGRKKAKPSA